MSRNKKPEDRSKKDAEDNKLWHLVTKGIKPIHKKPDREIKSEEDRGSPTIARPQSTVPKKTLAQGLDSGPDSGFVARPKKPAPQGYEMDRKTALKFKKGEFEVEAQLDLHGLTVSEAKRKTISFLKKAFAKHQRCVLVITGKGRYDPEGGRAGRLKHEFPFWLEDSDIRPMILRFSFATQRHGGDGAYYVLLRRQRSP